MEDGITYKDFRTVADLRPTGKHGQRYGEDMENLYDSMINMIVNHKMELQKIPQCSAIATAREWATKRGLTAGEQDFNRDGINEVVVYNKAGQPMIINGYKPRASDFGMRHAYWSENTTAEKRIDAGPMRQWVQKKAYNVTADPNNPWKRTITRTEWGEKLKDTGYKMPTKPKKSFSVFSVFSKLIAPYVKTYFENGYLIDLLGEDCGKHCAKLLKKLISPISMYRMLFMKCVERWYFYQLYSMNPSPLRNGTYKDFKEYVKKNPNKFWTFFKTNLLKDDMTGFKENIINDDVIARLFVKGAIDLAAPDPDDAIIFLMGIENARDHEFELKIRSNQAAKDYLEMLADKKHYKDVKKEFEKWKKRAQKSTKEFFASLQQELFENNAAFARFSERVQNGQNPIDPSDEAQPASPTRTVEEQTAREERPPTAVPSAAQSGDEGDDLVEEPEDDI